MWYSYTVITAKIYTNCYALATKVPPITISKEPMSSCGTFTCFHSAKIHRANKTVNNVFMLNKALTWPIEAPYLAIAKLIQATPIPQDKPNISEMLADCIFITLSGRANNNTAPTSITPLPITNKYGPKETPAFVALFALKFATVKHKAGTNPPIMSPSVSVFIPWLSTINCQLSTFAGSYSAPAFLTSYT